MEQLRYERETLSAIVSMHVAEIAELKERGHETERQLGRAYFTCFTGTKLQIELKGKGRGTASACVLNLLALLVLYLYKSKNIDAEALCRI